MATHASTLAWKIQWTEEPCRLQSMGSQRVTHNLATEHLSVSGSVCICISQFIHSSTQGCIHLPIYSSIYPSIHPSLESAWLTHENGWNYIQKNWWIGADQLISEFLRLCRLLVLAEHLSLRWEKSVENLKAILQLNRAQVLLDLRGIIREQKLFHAWNFQKWKLKTLENFSF